MELVDILARVVHIAFAAVWFGHKLAVPADLRRSTHVMSGPDPGLIARMRQWNRLDHLGAAGTVASGALLVYLRGPGDVALTVWVGVVLSILLVAATVVVARPARVELRHALETGDRPEATAAARRLVSANNVETLIWLAALAAMLA